MSGFFPRKVPEPTQVYEKDGFTRRPFRFGRGKKIATTSPLHWKLFPKKKLTHKNSRWFKSVTFFKIKKRSLKVTFPTNQPTFDVQVTENFTIVQKGHRIFRRTALYMKLINLPNLSPKNQQKNWEVLRIIWWKLPSSPPPPWQFLSATFPAGFDHPLSKHWPPENLILLKNSPRSSGEKSPWFRWVEPTHPKNMWTSNWVGENFFPNSSGAKSWQQQNIWSWPPPIENLGKY